MGSFLTVADLAPHGDIDVDLAASLIAMVEARASVIAPCILLPETQGDPSKFDAVASILLDVVLRRRDAGAGAVSSTTQAAGPWQLTQSIDTRAPTRGLFRPDEIRDLQSICDRRSSMAFTVDMSPGFATSHRPWCDVAWGGHCSCGANLTAGGGPLWEA